MVMPGMIATSFVQAYVAAAIPVSVEVYPIEARSMGYGAMGAVGRISSVFMPFVVAASLYNISLVLYAFGGLNLGVALMSWFWIPETRGRNIEDTSRDELLGAKASVDSPK